MNEAINLKESNIVGVLNKQEGNPRNSEGSFLPLKDGRIAFAYSRYSGTSYHDHGDCNICVIYSYDKGTTFDTENYEVLVNASEYGEKNVMSVTLRYMNNGDIGLFYLLKRLGASEYRLRRYKNDFSECLGEVKCLPHNYNSYFVVNNDRVLHTKDGKWIIPAAYHHSSIDNIGQYCDMRATVFFFTSEDDGYTWSQNSEVLRLADTYSKSGLQEPGLVELNGGVFYCYARTDRMYQYESVSIDGGKHWFMPQPSRFASPNSPMLIKKNPYNEMYYAIWNPSPPTFSYPATEYNWGRTPFVIAQSVDGVNFSEPTIIEDDKTRGFCYPALEFLNEKTMLLAYCGGGLEDGWCLNKTIIRKLVLA